MLCSESIKLSKMQWTNIEVNKLLMKKKQKCRFKDEIRHMVLFYVHQVNHTKHQNVNWIKQVKQHIVKTFTFSFIMKMLKKAVKRSVIY